MLEHYFSLLISIGFVVLWLLIFLLYAPPKTTSKLSLFKSSAVHADINVAITTTPKVSLVFIYYGFLIKYFIY